MGADIEGSEAQVLMYVVYATYSFRDLLGADALEPGDPIGFMPVFETREEAEAWRVRDGDLDLEIVEMIMGTHSQKVTPHEETPPDGPAE